jgi:poly-beta-1,6-N-acetyl-D-glucosamine synthase
VIRVASRFVSSVLRFTGHRPDRVFIIGVLIGAIFNIVRLPRDLARARALRGAVDEEIDLSSPRRVSILVAAWNEAPMIRRHIESVKQLRYPNLEHVICAGGADLTEEVAKACRWSGLVLLRQEAGEGKQRALARCLNAASGDIAVLTDADCELDNRSFESLVEPIIQGQEHVTTGLFRPVPEQLSNPFVVHRWAATSYRALQAGSYVSGITGANAAIRTDLLRESRVLDEDVWIGGDYHLAVRLGKLGYRIRFMPSSEPAVHFEEKFWAYARQRSRWLGGILWHAVPGWNVYDVVVVGVFYGVGQAFIWLPALVPVFGRRCLALWGAGLVCAMLNRCRYLLFTRVRTGGQVEWGLYLHSVFLVTRDMLALAYAPLDMLMRLRDRRW